MSVNDRHPPLRVLLAESSALVREGLRQMLADVSGVSIVGEAASSADLQALLRSTKTDLILLDLGLPGPNLLAAITSHKAMRPGTRVIALSQLCSPALDQRCLEAGADLVLSKTFGLEQLVEAIIRFARRPVPGSRLQQTLPR